MGAMRPFIAALVLALLPGCAVDRQAVASSTPEALPEYDRQLAEEAAAQAAVSAAEGQVESAAQSPDPSDDLPAAEALAAANRRLAGAEEALAGLEERAARRQAEPLAGLLPYGLGALALEAVAALSSRRKRSLYASAFRSMSKGKLYTAAGDVLRAMGAMHSRPETVATSGYVSSSSAEGATTIVINTTSPSA